MSKAHSIHKPVAPSVAPAVKLVAIDLDGTLLTSRKQVCVKALSALKCLRARGVKVVIASARPPRSVRRIYEELGLDTWQINYNGALIWEETKRKAVFHRPISCSLVRQMIDVARDLFDEVIVSCEIMDRWYTDRGDMSHTTETGRLFKKPDVLAPFDEWCTEPITKLMLLGDPRILARIEPVLLTQFGDKVTIVHADEDLLQIMHNKVSKATALKKVADHYKVPMANVLAIGDAPNDVAMIQTAGIGVAMGNASRHVKKIADWVAPSNDDHGVHATLAKFGLCD